MVANILICTLIMWGLTAIAVIPLAKRMFAKAVASNPDLSLVANSESLSEEMKAKIQSLHNTMFIKADMLVMGIAGFISGLAGFPLIGFAWKANAWPGLLALMGASFLSFYATGGKLR